MNNKGFAVTLMVYSAIILLSLVMFSILGIEKNKYINQKDYTENIDKQLNEQMNKCIKEGDC